MKRSILAVFCVMAAAVPVLAQTQKDSLASLIQAGNRKAGLEKIRAGADVNEADEDGHTPLDYCTGIAHTWQFKSGQRHPKLAALLRKQGAVHGSDLNANNTTR